MSKLSNLIFNGKEHYITSPFGKRAFDEVPIKLKEQVKEILIADGLEELITE